MTAFIYVKDSDTQALHCVNCGQMLMVVRGRIISYTTGDNYSYNDVKASTDYITHICHRCKYKVNLLIVNKN
jgi:hypothetical protein